MADLHCLLFEHGRENEIRDVFDDCADHFETSGCVSVMRERSANSRSDKSQGSGAEGRVGTISSLEARARTAFVASGLARSLAGRDKSGFTRWKDGAFDGHVNGSSVAISRLETTAPCPIVPTPRVPSPYRSNCVPMSNRSSNRSAWSRRNRPVNVVPGMIIGSSNSQRLSYQSGAYPTGKPKATVFPVVSSTGMNHPGIPPSSRERRRTDAEKTCFGVIAFFISKRCQFAVFAV